METKILPVLDAAAISEAAALLQAGQVVAMPTETVYGLAADATNSAAVRRIFEAKGRPGDNPLIVHICNMDMLEGVAREAPAEARKLAEVFWPGPLTMVLPKARGLAAEVSAGLDTVGVRLPAHEGARVLIEAAGVPLAAPSANCSGSPSPTTAAHVLADMKGKIPLVLDGGACPVGVESTVLSLVGEPVVLRPGFVTVEEISEALGRPVKLHEAITAPLLQGQAAQSPGMKYKHYAPKARVTIVESGFEDFCAYVNKRAAEGVWALCFESEQGALEVPCILYGKENDDAAQAAKLFGALRQMDEVGAKTVYARSPHQRGVGLAVYNRLLRAAAFRVEKL